MDYLNCGLNQLIKLNSINRQNPNALPYAHDLFSRIYEDYLSGNTSSLKAYEAEVLETKNEELILNYQLKLAARFSTQNEFDIPKAEEVFERACDPYFKAELAFGIARIIEKRGLWLLAADWYQKSEKLYLDLNLEEKTARCELNKYCCLYNERKDPALVSYFLKLYSESIRRKNFELACHSLNNISRTYFGMRAFLTAYKYNCKALALSDWTSPMFRDSAKLHQAEILFQIGKLDEGKQLIEECLASVFEEIRNAALYITQKESKINQDTLPEPYKIKLNSSFKLSAGEAKFFDYLMIQARTLEECILFLYGSKINYASAQNRLGNLLFRVRKKTNAKILIKDGSIFIQK